MQGVADLFQAAQPQKDYMLNPYRHSEIDSLIGSDLRVRNLLSEFNRRGDFSDEAVARVEARVTSIVRGMQAEQGWTHGYDGYTATLQAVPRGAQGAARDGRGRPTVMLPGDYSAIERSEAARHAAALEETRRESDAFYAREHDSTLGTGSFLDDLLRDDAAYQNATSYHERNLRIREIIDELAPGEYADEARSGKGMERYAQDIKGMDTPDVPQYDAGGNLVMQRWSDAPPTAPQAHEVVHGVVAAHDQP